MFFLLFNCFYINKFVLKPQRFGFRYVDVNRPVNSLDLHRLVIVPNRGAYLDKHSQDLRVRINLYPLVETDNIRYRGLPVPEVVENIGDSVPDSFFREVVRVNPLAEDISELFADSRKGVFQFYNFLRYELLISLSVCVNCYFALPSLSRFRSR